MTDPGATMDSGRPIQGVDTPPAEPAGQPAPTPDLSGGPIRSQVPTHGPNPTAQGVRGYRNLTDDEVSRINQLKELQVQVARVWASVYLHPGVDRRKANLSKTHFEDAFSCLVGAIARPEDPFAVALLELQSAATAALLHSTRDDPEPPSGKATMDDQAPRPREDR